MAAELALHPPRPRCQTWLQRQFAGEPTARSIASVLRCYFRLECLRVEALALQIIETLPPTLHRLTIDLDDDMSRVRPAAGEWSTVEIVGHLIDKTKSWGER